MRLVCDTTGTQDSLTFTKTTKAETLHPSENIFTENTGKQTTTTDKRKFPLATNTATNEHWKKHTMSGRAGQLLAIMEDGKKHLSAYPFYFTVILHVGSQPSFFFYSTKYVIVLFGVWEK